MQRDKITEEMMTEAHFKARGHMGKTAKYLGITRATLYEWMNEPDGKVKEALKEGFERTKDHWEAILRHKAEGKPKLDSNGEIDGYEIEPDLTALSRILKAKAPERGYGQANLKLDVQDGTNITITRKVVSRKDTEESAG